MNLEEDHFKLASDPCNLLILLGVLKGAAIFEEFLSLSALIVALALELPWGDRCFVNIRNVFGRKQCGGELHSR